MSELKIKSVEFRNEREQDWQELERLVELAEKKGVTGMSAQDVARLPIYYRGVLSSLSVARAISLDANLLEYLENLANRAYIRVYGVRHRLGEAFAIFLSRRFPCEVRAFRWMIVLAAVFFFMGLGTGFFMTLDDPDNYYRFISPEYADGRDPSATTEELREVLYYEEGNVWDGLSFFSSFLFNHNAQIAIYSFALGFVAGIPVFYLMFTNGQLLGAMAALYHQHGLSVEFWGWLLPHGITEIGALLLCAGAGLVLAQALILPGRYGRLRNLSRLGRRAGLIVLGGVVMLACAALIEGFFRQLVHDTTIRYVVAGGSLVLWSLYFGFVGRSRI